MGEKLLEIVLPDEVESQVKRAAIQKGAKEEDIVLEALRYYFSVLADEGLSQELQQWDLLSDEALAHFEREQLKG